MEFSCSRLFREKSDPRLEARAVTFLGSVLNSIQFDHLTFLCVLSIRRNSRLFLLCFSPSIHSRIFRPGCEPYLFLLYRPGTSVMPRLSLKSQAIASVRSDEAKLLTRGRATRGGRSRRRKTRLSPEKGYGERRV